MKAFIMGCGGHGRVILDILSYSKEYDVIYFIDGDPQKHGGFVDGIAVLGDIGCIGELKRQKVRGGIVGIGENETRTEYARLLELEGFELINAVHPEAHISRTAKLGKNCVVAPGAVICTHSILGDSVIINTGAIVEHQNVIKEGAHIAPGVRFAGHVTVGEKAFVGLGTCIIQNIHIGEKAIIGAGSVVLEDVEASTLVAGNPAMLMKSLD